MIKAVIYARVSSKEQEEEGFSIPADQLLKIISNVEKNIKNIEDRLPKMRERLSYLKGL